MVTAIAAALGGMAVGYLFPTWTKALFVVLAITVGALAFILAALVMVHVFPIGGTAVLGLLSGGMLCELYHMAHPSDAECLSPEGWKVD